MFMTMLGKNLAVIAEIPPSIDSENSARLDETAKLVSSLSTSAGPIKVKRIPMPPKWGNDWRSYTNVIMANGVLLMPSFSDVDPVLEDQAEEVYRSLLPPDWEVKRIDCSSLVALRGQLHCISYNIPQFISIDGLQEKAFPRSQENKN
jgi:agmatine/peptidylarginine deiminase